MRLRSFRVEITVCRKSTGVKQKYSASNPRDAITVLGYSNKKIHALSVFIQFWANNLNVKDKLPQNGKKRVIVNSILQWSLWPRWGTKESGHCRGSFSFDWEDTSHSTDNVGFLIWLATRVGEMNQIPRCERGTILFARGYRLCPASRIIILRVYGSRLHLRT